MNKDISFRCDNCGHMWCMSDYGDLRGEEISNTTYYNGCQCPICNSFDISGE